MKDVLINCNFDRLNQRNVKFTMTTSMASNMKIRLKEASVNPNNGKIYFTYADLQKLTEFPDSPLLEIINGELYMVPSPSTIHQTISVNLTVIFGNFLKKNPVGKIFHAPIDVILSDTDVVIPDLVFVRKERLKIVTHNNIRGTPDLIIEILSVSNKKRDLIEKKNLYERFGIKEYWIVNPEIKSVLVYLLQPNNTFGSPLTYHLGEQIPVTTVPGLTIPVDAIFE